MANSKYRQIVRDAADLSREEREQLIWELRKMQAFARWDYLVSQLPREWCLAYDT